MEVKSEQGMLGGREQFGMGLQKNPVQPQPQPQPQPPMQNMRLAFTPDGTAIYKPVAGSSPTYQGAGAGGAAAGGGSESAPPAMVAPHGLNMAMGDPPLKRKRGRPRKYGPDGTMALALAPVSPAGLTAGSAGFASPGVGGTPNPVVSPSALSASSGGMKKARGRPPGSGKKQQMSALGSAGIGFTPHVITVKTGEVDRGRGVFLEVDRKRRILTMQNCMIVTMHSIGNGHIFNQDVSSKIMSFSQHGPRAVCILSANGAISNVTLRQAAMSGGTVTYEGRFEILSLSGSFLLSESGGQRSRTGGLSVSLAGPDGRVLGGGVAGLLTAASPVQVVVGSFIADGGRKETKLTSSPEMLPAAGKFTSGMSTGPSSPPSRGTLSESSGGPGSPLNQSSGACNNGNQQGMSNMPWK